jgi:hypothetical protein
MAKSKIQQCQHLPSDKDRLRMIENVGTQFLLAPKQAADFCSTCTGFGKTVEAAAALQDKTSDEEEFIHLALQLCKFPEDRIAMCGMLGIELVPLPSKEDPKPRARKLTINSGLGQGQGTRPTGF